MTSSHLMRLGNIGKPLHSMNLDDELQKNVISTDQSGQLVQDLLSDHNSFILPSLKNNNIGTLSNKTNNNINRPWKEIVHQEHVNRSMDTPLKQPSLGETLESFLVRAGVIDVGDHQDDNNDNVVVGGNTHHQALMGMDPVVMLSQKEHWLQLKIPIAIDMHQHQEQHHQQRDVGEHQDLIVPKSLFYENQEMEIGYSENPGGISVSPTYSDSKSAIFGKNKYSDEVLEKTIERKQKRMAKNRESVVRSRTKKQIYVVDYFSKRACQIKKI
ncbi:hypothetical protein GYH30_035553 [Glycine max]|uniref:BZIP domain-containing protein n=1 Tax=Glycine max TaxID=3847 RepID=A0A0R0GTX8_SOYBN|nr:hypothetical protein GYH30_035553 [Glycine max]